MGTLSNIIESNSNWRMIIHYFFDKNTYLFYPADLIDNYNIDRKNCKLVDEATFRAIINGCGQRSADSDGNPILIPYAPSEYHTWNGTEWIISEEKQAELLAIQQAEVWERIKEYRYNRSLGGVYIVSVDKWFQTGEEEKTKYLGLSQVIDKLGSISWKTFENDFVEMTPDLLAKIFAEMVRAENADHVNAERHKVAMMQSDKPLEYDYTAGWERRYAD